MPRMTPEFLKLKRKWDRKLGPALNRIDRTIAAVGSSFDLHANGGMSVVSYDAFDSLGGEVFIARMESDRPGSDHARAVELVREAVDRLPKDYVGRKMLVKWAYGEARNGAGSMSAIGIKAGVSRNTAKATLRRFLKRFNLRNPWSRTVRTPDTSLCALKGCGKLGPHSPHGTGRTLSKREIRTMERNRGK